MEPLIELVPSKVERKLVTSGLFVKRSEGIDPSIFTAPLKGSEKSSTSALLANRLLVLLGF